MVGKYGRSESRYHIHVDRIASANNGRAGSNNTVIITFILICNLVVGGVFCLANASDNVFFPFNVLYATP